MQIYIASSWKNQHAVEMLTDLLEQRGHRVVSFVRVGVKPNEVDQFGGFDNWVWSDNGREKFHFDLDGAMNSDLVIYIGPSGTDAWAEIGAAWAVCQVKGHPLIFGLYSKGEQSGLMRRMVNWHFDYRELLKSIDLLEMPHKEIANG